MGISMSTQYMLERCDHGWIIEAPPGRPGIPVTALSECSAMFPKDAGIYSGIAHHYKNNGRPGVVICIATPNDSKRWIYEIEQSLKRYACPQRAWWVGTDVGKSSAAMFAVLCDDPVLIKTAADFSRGAIPYDADDFGRCHRLLNRFPEWRMKLDAVANRYPDTKWPAIIQQWSKIELATPEKQTEILREINK